MRFRDLRLATKQVIAFGLILVIMAGVSTYATLQVYALRAEINEVSNNWLPRMIAISNLNLSAAGLRISQLQHALSNDATTESLLVETMLSQMEAIDENRDTYEALQADTTRRHTYTEEEDQLYRSFDELWYQYQDQFMTMFSLYEAGEKQQAVNLLNGSAGTIFNAFSEDLQKLVEINKNASADAARRAGKAYRSTRDITTYLSMGTILLSILFAFGLVRYVTVPIRQIEKAAGSVAKGNLKARIDLDSKDELGMLARSFNGMTAALEQARNRMEQQALELQAQQEELRTANFDLETQKSEIELKNRDLEEALQQLRFTQQQLLVKEKLASLGQLTAGIAHEIKNPLNFINNFAILITELVTDLDELLRDNRTQKVEDTLEEVEDILANLSFNAQKINEHGRRADGIVRSMLLHSRGKAGERQPVELNTLIDEYLTLAYHGMRASDATFNTTVERDFDPMITPIRLVPHEIGRVVLNLLNNAFYAVQQKSHNSPPSYVPVVRVTTRHLENGVAISIKDNGPGIADEVRERIFEPFFTTKPTGSGTGLGLSLSYDIVVNGHNGSISVESTPGAGAVFTISLPGATDDEKAATRDTAGTAVA